MHLEIHEKKPDDFANHVEVAGGLLLYEGEFLHLKRPPSFKPDPEAWGIPAGRIDEGESPLEAMQRELREETGIQAPLSAFISLGHLYFRRKNVDFVFHFFHLPLIERPEVILNNEHTDYDWFTHSKLSKIKVMTGNNEAVDYILKKIEERSCAS